MSVWGSTFWFGLASVSLSPAIAKNKSIKPEKFINLLAIPVA
jgi:hypothetical protein